ncbi:helix-turn-helix domain-containing protein [Streptomyces sp. CA-288835]|uniref:helix-turn-helix domain-containing protein n=1 Tax=Streptomyces sp. CA-288835 TaxID=3240069 RepID=UPI003D8D7257
MQPVTATTDFSGSALRRCRTARGFTCPELAEIAGCSEAMIHVLEQGKARPSVPLLCRLADALGTHPAVLFTGVEDRR